MSHNLWDNSLQALRSRVDEKTFEAWLAWTRFSSYENGHLVVFVPNSFTGNWLNSRYSDLITTTVGSLVEDFKQITFVPDEALQTEMISEVHSIQMEAPPKTHTEPASATFPHLNSKYTFEDFIIGPSNRFAHAAAKAVCETPASDH